VIKIHVVNKIEIRVICFFTIRLYLVSKSFVEIRVVQVGRPHPNPSPKVKDTLY